MRKVGRVALVFSLVCLVVSAFSLVSRTTVSDCASSPCTSWDCGSPAFPRGQTELRQDAAEQRLSRQGQVVTGDRVAVRCARERPEPRAFYSALLAGLGLVVVAVSSWRPRPGLEGGRLPAAT